MNPHPTLAKTAFGAGVLFFILGELVMCHCPWLFVIATVFFGGSWLLAVDRLRAFALLFFAISIVGAIYEMGAKQQFEERMQRLREKWKLTTSALSQKV